MKKILGLDIGTNSIGWAYINWDDENFNGHIIDMGSRIIPTDVELLSNYETGLAASKNAGRRQARGARRLQQRYKLRRQRLVDAMKILGWLPEHFKVGDELPVSQNILTEMRAAFGREEISADWIPYYLRHKAISQEITKEELARILYHINQRRGFRSNRKVNEEIVPDIDEADEQTGRKKREKKIEIVHITKIEESGEKLKGNPVFNIHFKDGRMATTVRRTLPDWQGEKELEITYIPPTKKDEERWECRMPDKTDWQKNKEALEKDIALKGLFPGDYFFQELLRNASFRIKERIIDRKLYEAEIRQILETQFAFNPGWLAEAPLAEISANLYPHNQQKQQEIKNGTLTHLLITDIIYYQRPLKSQKSSIAVCRFEKEKFITEKGVRIGVKVAPASSPVFQEFRIWQTINNIRILEREYRNERGLLETDFDVSGQFINTGALETLFELFDGKEKVSQKQILKSLGNLNEKKYLINLYRQDEEKELPGNETKALIRKMFKRAGVTETENKSILNNPVSLEFIWHTLYSLDQEQDIFTTLSQHNKKKTKPIILEEAVARELAKAPAFKQQYGSLSAKAMKKLLPLMKAGKYWNADTFDANTRQRIENILTGEFDSGVSDHTRELFKAKNITGISDFQGLQTPMAAYAVYGVHSEREKNEYTQPGQIQIIGQYELRNPVVTQVVNETLKTVKDIWQITGEQPTEIHIELARELRKTAAERAKSSKQIADNRRENERIAAILRELPLGGNPNSLGDIEKLKLWEQQADITARATFKDVKFKRSSEPTKDEIQKYKLWCGQKHLSPYSGEIIPISKLFTKEYEVDHIIPRSRYFDDSFENKVVVESTLNKEKDNRTAYQYIKDGSTKGCKLLKPYEYEEHITRYFFFKKRRLLLSETVPDGFIQRQLNDTKYISRKLNELLSPIAQNQADPIIVTSGIITNELKTRWGLSEKMKEAVKWRFERLEQKTGKPLINKEPVLKNGELAGKTILKLDGYEKRIDHRHHALDALVIACTTKSHIQYINTLNAQRSEPELKMKLSYLLDKQEGGKPGTYKFKLPWKSFVPDTETALNGIIISFKNRIHLAGKRKNRNIKFIQQENGQWVKTAVDQEIKKSPYIRQSLHKATFAGKIMLPQYKSVTVNEALSNIPSIANKQYRLVLAKALTDASGEINKAKKILKDDPLKNELGETLAKVDLRIATPYFVNRVLLDASFDEKKINKIPDKPLAETLKKHLASFDGNPKEAFTAEGIEKLNNERIAAGKQPVHKVRIMEESVSKFEISKGKWVEADKGTNLFFVIYEKPGEPGTRLFESIPLRTVIEAKINGDGQFVEQKEGHKYFLLSPNDLVYVPDEGENINAIDWKNDKDKISCKVYKVVSCNKSQCFFIPQTVSQVIQDKIEFDSGNKVERGLDGRMIKHFCIKLNVNRLGHVKPA
jgi:CRISPR-associated endonuclease Csn1